MHPSGGFGGAATIEGARDGAHPEGYRVVTSVPARPRIVVCDIRPIARAGLVAMLEQVGTVRACDPSALGATLDADGGDVVVVGVGVAGDADARFDAVIEAGGERRLPCVALLDRLDEAELRAAFVAGALGVVACDVEAEVLLDVVVRVRAGERVGPAFEAAPSSGGPLGPQRPLRPAELRVLELMADGLTNEAIAERLDIAARTVKTHVQNLIVQLSASDRTSAVARALRLGLID